MIIHFFCAATHYTYACTLTVASFPRLHAQLLPLFILQVTKAGSGDLGTRQYLPSAAELSVCWSALAVSGSDGKHACMINTSNPHMFGIWQNVPEANLYVHTLGPQEVFSWHIPVSDQHCWSETPDLIIKIKLELSSGQVLPYTPVYTM